MKKNLPVTQMEVDYPETTNLLSTTDIRGLVTYCNEDFIKLSGFTMEELQGKSHNIVRHPDVPTAAFKDLWMHLHSKRPWMGIVKNRCKNGNHYWVDAFVTPITQNGKIVECQSVCSKPSRELVERADKTYRRINEGKWIGASWPTIPLIAKSVFANAVCALPGIISIALGKPSETILWSSVVGLTAGLGLTAFFIAPFRKLVKQSQTIVSNKLMQYIYTGRTDDIGQVQVAMKLLTSEMRAMVGRMQDMSKNQIVNAEKLFRIWKAPVKQPTSKLRKLTALLLVSKR
ncbi:MAG: PAS domain-containing protein [Deltaproteobacteria bacterium]|nr:MAG: PAS domain-containing protein [Deltaproteobacteria bacterium]